MKGEGGVAEYVGKRSSMRVNGMTDYGNRE